MRSFPEKYRDDWTDDGIAFEYIVSNPFVADIQYDTKTKRVTVGTAYTDEEIKKNHYNTKLESDGATKTGTFEFRNGAGRLCFLSEYDGSRMSEENHITWVSTVYESIAFTKVKGTITVRSNSIDEERYTNERKD